MGTHTDNKTGDDLKAQRFQMLEDIAKELSGEVVFPTYFDAVLRLRKVLQDPAVKKRIEDTGSLVIGNSPQEFAKELKDEFDTYKQVVSKQKLTLE